MLSLEFENLVTAHGPAQVGNARSMVGANLGRIWPVLNHDEPARVRRAG